MAASVDEALRFLRGIGPAKAAALAAAGLETAWDVLHAVPHCLGPPPPLVDDGPLPRAAEVRTRARVVKARPIFGRGRGRGLTIDVALERPDRSPAHARFWNAGYLRRHFIAGEWYLFSGRTDPLQPNWFLHPSFLHLPSGTATPLPVEAACRTAYTPLPEGFSERGFAELVAQCLDGHLPALADPAGTLPDGDYQALILALHRPASAEDHERARRALAERELLALAWLLQARRAGVTGQPGKAWRWNDDIHQRALARLPFTLTPGQVAAMAEIRADMQARQPMYRLLHGDVGSGKTALALLAALAVIADGGQVLLLAPTAVLAEQHRAFCARCLAGSKVAIAVLTGGKPTVERRDLLDRLAERELHLLIGTHALLDDEVRPAELGLVVIDEQHKFGVAQRSTLIQRATAAQGYQPDLLLLTATPIPRTLALTAYGDLAVSRIAGKPPGRGTVATELRHLRDLAQLDVPVTETLAAGGQAFVICPLRQESEKLEAADADSVFRHLAGRFGADKVGLIHGALAEERKLALVADFAAARTAVLVSTTVVEVGIDVPGATLMAVLDAERFGLAQLHQLRGRIGRGERPGRCLYFFRDPEAGKRLDILARSDDGLEIAEADLAQRGPGELLGSEQHGALRLRIADLARDLDLLQAAHQTARTRLAAGETLPAGLARFQRHLGDAATLAGG